MLPKKENLELLLGLEKAVEILARDEGKHPEDLVADFCWDGKKMAVLMFD